MRSSLILWHAVPIALIIGIFGFVRYAPLDREPVQALGCALAATAVLMLAAAALARGTMAAAFSAAALALALIVEWGSLAAFILKAWPEALPATFIAGIVAGIAGVRLLRIARRE